MLSIMGTSKTTIPMMRLLKLFAVAASVAAGAMFDRALRRQDRHSRLARRVRRAFEILGPTFVKAGQLLSSSSTPLPKVWMDEMARCRDQVRSAAWPAVDRLLRQELGDRFSLLAEIDPVPMAAGSMAQVHSARLADGTAVVVKVQRPGLEKILADDMRLLRLAARLAVRVSAPCAAANATALVEDFARGLEQQLSFRREADNAREMARALASLPVHVPSVYSELSSDSVLVMERLQGAPSDEPSAVDALGVDRSVVVGEIVSTLLVPALRYGVFHADMHPGNVVVLPDGRLGLLDFGVIGRLDATVREAATELLSSLAERRLADVTFALLKVVDVSSGDISGLLPDMQSLVAGTLDKPLADVDVREVITNILALASRHGFILPDALVALFKQVLYISGMCQVLDPAFAVLDDLGPIVGLARTPSAVAA